MNFTLHLTEGCNLACTYCPNPKSKKRMSEETLYAACELAFSRGKSAGFCFFGGEPLLEKELIYKALDRCEQLAAEKNMKTSFRMTTNGTLLDPDFIRRAKSVGMVIGISFDGLAQDNTRKFVSGEGTLSVVSEKAKLLLSEMPNSYAMMTVAPSAVPQYLDSVKYLYDLGFRRVIATVAYGPKVHWTDDDMQPLREQLESLAKFYSDILITGERFYFSPFDSKIGDCIKDKNPDDHCHLGFRQMPIDTDGKIYPCTQFIGDPDWCVGSVFDGIDTNKQIEISRRATVPQECMECALNKRCTNACGCTNRLETGDENKVSPFQCNYQQMLIDVSDRMAERLCAEHYEMFRRHFAR